MIELNNISKKYGIKSYWMIFLYIWRERYYLPC